MKCRACGKEISDDSRFCTFCGTKVEEQHDIESNESVTSKTKAKSKFWVKTSIVILTIIVFVGIGLIVGKTLESKSGKINENAIAYVSGGELLYKPDMDKDDVVHVCEVYGNISHDLKFTSDGKYLYYISKKTAKSNTICRAEVGKLKDNSKGNDKYIVEIDSGISDYTLLDNEKQMLYIKDDDSLNYYDGESTECIQKNIKDYNLFEGDIVVYLTSNGELRYCDLDNKEEGKIDDNVSCVQEYASKEFILYKKDEWNLYCGSIKEETEKITSEINTYVACDAKSKTVYYTVLKEVNQDLNAFFDDEYKDIDANVKKMDKSECLVIVKKSEVHTIGGFPVDSIYKYPLSYDYINDYDEELDMYRYTGYNGAIYYWDEGADQWYVFDMDKYEEYLQYEDAEYRNKIREELKSGHIMRCELYSYVMGEKNKCISEDIAIGMGVHFDGSALYYCAFDQNIDNKICDIDDVDRVDYANIWVQEELDNRQTDWFYYVNEKEQKIDIEGEISSVDILTDGNEVIFGSRNRVNSTLTVYSIKNGVMEKKDELTDAGRNICVKDDGYYFFSNIYGAIGDLNVYKDGETKCILKDINIKTARVYDDEIYTVINKNDTTSETDDTLVVTGASDNIKITGNVSAYSCVNGNRIVYIDNGELHVYKNNDEDKLIADDVGEYECFENTYYTID